MQQEKAPNLTQSVLALTGLSRVLRKAYSESHPKGWLFFDRCFAKSF